MDFDNFTSCYFHFYVNFVNIKDAIGNFMYHIITYSLEFFIQNFSGDLMHKHWVKSH